MNIETFRNYCLSLPYTTESMPFGDGVLVFKVMGKMYALANIDLFQSINLKCDPEKAIELRAQYPEVKPGYHMNKQHWNTVETDNMSDKLLMQWIKDSYLLVVNKLKVADRKKVMEAL